MPEGSSEMLLALYQTAGDASVLLTVVCGCSMLVFRRYLAGEFAELVAAFAGHIAMLCTSCDTMHWPRYSAEIIGG